MILHSQGITKEIKTMFTDFDYFIDTLNIEALEKILCMPLTEEEKKVAIGYVIVRPLEGVSMSFPKKNHLTAFAKLLITQGVETKIIANKLEIHERTIKKYKEKHGKK